MTARYRRRSSGSSRGWVAAAALLAAVAAAGGGPAGPGVAEAVNPAVPASGQLAAADIYQLALAAGLPPAQAVTGTAVALAESAGDVDVAGDEGLVDGEWGPSIGLWQIRCLHAATGTGAPRDCSRLTDPGFNAAAMAAISAGGTSWQPWSAYTSGAYAAHLGAAEAAAREAGQ